MSLLDWIEQTLERITPSVRYVAGAVASMASVLASLSWLLGQALDFVRGN